jgi:uncharacterized membrane protein YdbT with pleckstrin-like domain
MQPRVIRPSLKIIRLWYALSILVIAAGAVVYVRYLSDLPQWAMAVPAIVLLIPIRKQIDRKLVALTIHDGRLTVESGFLSKSRRTMDLVKVQDVTVRQTFPQRLLCIGDLSFETASESGPITVRTIDRPREVADAILEGSRKLGPGL